MQAQDTFAGCESTEWTLVSLQKLGSLFAFVKLVITVITILQEEFPEVFVEKVTDFLRSLPDKVPAARGTPRRDINLDVRAPVLGSDVTSVEAAPTSL